MNLKGLPSRILDVVLKPETIQIDRLENYFCNRKHDHKYSLLFLMSNVSPVSGKEHVNSNGAVHVFNHALLGPSPNSMWLLGTLLLLERL